MSAKRKSLWVASGILIASCATVVGASMTRDNVSTSPLAEVTPAQRAALDSANDLSTAFQTVSNALLPTVVAIENRPKVVMRTDARSVPSNDPFGGRNPFEGTPMEELFRDFQFRGGSPNIPRQPMRSGIGSGVIIDSSGIVLTNNHVVAGGGEVMVRTQDGREFVATDVWTDPKTDLAVVKIDADGLVAAPLGNSDEAAIGEWVLALGQPFGLESTVTSGIISAKHRDLGITDRENFLQTDAAINPGNSGGPLVNLRGEVIGINTAIHSRSGGNNGIGFAVPSNLARWVSDQLIDGGKVRRAFLGIGIQSISESVASEWDVTPRSGVLVTEVMERSPADDAGLQAGDVIVSVAERRVSTPQALQLAVERSPIGDQVEMKVIRDGKTIALQYVAAEQSGSEAS